MLKNIIVLMLSVISLNAYSADRCHYKAESIVRSAAPGVQILGSVLVAESHNGDLEYHVRSNLQGGDAAYKVMLNKKCKYISIEMLWSE